VQKSQNDIRSQLIEIIEPVCTDSGFELVDLRYQRENNGWVLRVFIDRESEPIGFDDCEQVSRELSAVLDVEDPVPTAYSLEVSSPGVERPLRTASHFRRFAGQVAKVALELGVDGRRNFKGVVEGFDDEHQTILMQVDGEQFSLPLSDLRAARLVVDWDAVLKGGAKAPKEQPGA
jgi:ribosome maturation factor RimP